MFCVKCGSEVDEDTNFCFKCGQDLSKYQKNIFEEINEELIEDINPEEAEEVELDENNVNLNAKISDLIDIISKLQDENSQLKKELENFTKYRKSSLSAKRSEFVKKMPKPDKREDLFARFKKWYNE